MGNCVAPSSDHSQNGRDGQISRASSRSTSSKGKEAKYLSSAKPALSCEKTGKGVVRVKLVIRKQELTELLANGFSKQEAIEDILAKNICAGAAERMSSHSGWRPSLESIPEDNNTCI